MHGTQREGMKPAEVDVLLVVALACIVVYGWFLGGLSGLYEKWE